MSRKKRSDSKLAQLSLEQQDQVADWLTTPPPQSYTKVKERIAAEFGLETSEAALCNFYSDYAAPRKYAQARDAADAFAGLMEGNFDEAIIKRAKQLAHDALTSPMPDVDMARTLLSIVGDSAKLALAERKVATTEQRIELLQVKAAEAVLAAAQELRDIARDSSLTTEQKTAAVRERLFGTKPADFQPVRNDQKGGAS